MTDSITAGTPAPDFTLPRDGGGVVTLSDLLGRQVVLYFYPKDDTPGCTREGIAFSEALEEFEAAGATVIGVSKDTAAKHDKFVAKHDLRSSSPPTPRVRPARTTAPGWRRACTARPTSGSNGRPF